MPPVKGLTNKQRAFIDAYLNSWNASDAARRAGYKGQDRSVGSQLLANINVAAELSRRIEERSVKPKEVRELLGNQARSKVGEFFKEVHRWTQWPRPTEEVIDEKAGVDEKGNPCVFYLARSLVLDLDKMLDPNYSKLVRKFTDSPKTGLSIELYDAQSALEKLGKAHGLFIDKTELTGKDGGPITLNVVYGNKRKPNPDDPAT